MKKILLFLPLLLILLTSAIPPQSEIVPASIAIKTDVKDSKVLLENVKGEKLSFKEKMVLKLAASKSKVNGQSSGGKSQIVALLLCWLVGIIGVHRFYLGYPVAGIIQLLTLGGLGIWTLIDLVRIITGSLTPKDGDYDKTF